MLKYITIFASLLFIASCGKVRVDPLEEIKSNETAFVIPLEGDTSAQKGFDSVDYLKKNQVATKRIIVSQRKRKTGRFYWNYEWIPTVKVLVVDRSPVTREWNGEDTNTNKNKPISVESKDSIGFAVGINITAHIEVEDTSTFLYHFRQNSLSSVIDTNIRGYLQSQLSEKFGGLALEECKDQKNSVITEARGSTVEHFKSFGITISSLGMAEGLTYEDAVIQEAINDAYKAEMEVKKEKQKTLAQQEINNRMLAKAQGERKSAEEFALASKAKKEQVELEVELLMAEKWNGVLPTTLMIGEGSSDVSFLKMLDGNK